MSAVVVIDNPALSFRCGSSVPVSVAAVAERLSGILRSLRGGAARPASDSYFMPYSAVHEPLARACGISGDGDLYGGIVREPAHADKAMLHELASATAMHPRWYSWAFARALHGAVLPGFTVFSPDDAACAFELMRRRGIVPRFKDPSATGGLGQSLVRSQADLAEALQAHGDRLVKTGAILEADLSDAATITVGWVRIGGKEFSWCGRPYDVVVDGQTRFGGNEIRVVRGGLGRVEQYIQDERDLIAIRQACTVSGAYRLLGTVAARATLDAVQGVDTPGKLRSGITDPSLRPSASSAAEVRALEAFIEHPDAESVVTQLVYDYGTGMVAADTAKLELFAGNTHVRIVVGVVEVT